MRLRRQFAMRPCQHTTYCAHAHSDKSTLCLLHSKVCCAGTMYKVKFGTDGAVHLHTESKVRPDTTVALSALLNARSLGEDPKLGIAVDHSP
jgi:hypothetical protein